MFRAFFYKKIRSIFSKTSFKSENESKLRLFRFSRQAAKFSILIASFVRKRKQVFAFLLYSRINLFFPTILAIILFVIHPFIAFAQIQTSDWKVFDYFEYEKTKEQEVYVLKIYYDLEKDIYKLDRYENVNLLLGDGLKSDFTMDTDRFEARVESFENEILTTYQLGALGYMSCWDGIDENGNAFGNCEPIFQGITLWRVPYFPNGKIIKIYDQKRNNQLIMSVDVSQFADIKYRNVFFSDQNQTINQLPDEAGDSEKSFFSIKNILMLAGIIILLSGGIYFYYRKKKQESYY